MEGVIIPFSVWSGSAESPPEEGRSCQRGRDRNSAGGYHPRCDRKSAEAIENGRDSSAPLRKRVRNCMKLLDLEGCDRKQRSWQFEVKWGRHPGVPDTRPSTAHPAVLYR